MNAELIGKMYLIDVDLIAFIDGITIDLYNHMKLFNSADKEKVVWVPEPLVTQAERDSFKSGEIFNLLERIMKKLVEKARTSNEHRIIADKYVEKSVFFPLLMFFFYWVLITLSMFLFHARIFDDLLRFGGSIPILLTLRRMTRYLKIFMMIR